MIGKYLGTAAEASFLRSLARPRYRIAASLPDDLERAAELVERYADMPLGGTDAIVVATAERLGLEAVATLDHRHFSVIRPRHVAAFQLLP